MEICVLCSQWFSNQFKIVSETPFSCDAVGHELYFARCGALKRTGTFAFEVMFCCLAFATSVCRSTIILRLRKVEFIKWIKLRNVLFIGLVKFEIKQWFTVYKDQFKLQLAQLLTFCKIFFLSHFLQKEMALSFFFLLDYASHTCSMPRPYIFVQSSKILSNFSKLSAI